MGNRPWLSDNGLLPPSGAPKSGPQPVNNLPAGALYTTVRETETRGELWTPSLGGARDVTLRFEGGRIAAVRATEGQAALEDLFARQTGEPRRVSHVGLGLNPYPLRDLDWPLVDEHRRGSLLLALGENRYLGGENASSLNIDLTMPGATLLADDQVIVANGSLVA
jgi:leucyl aminopeptidase (aminopeptidase T)